MIWIDMPMPKNCLECPACNEYLICAIPVNGRKWGENDIREFSQSRPKWCPLAEDAPTIDAAAQWVSVEDRLPSDQSPVLVYIDSYTDEQGEEYIPHVGMAYYTYSVNGGFWCGTDGNVYGAIGIIHTPTHWMPIPEGPEGVTQ